MKRLDDFAERLVWAVGRRSGRVVTVIALVFYGGVGLALPLAMSWPVNWLVGANVTGSTLAALAILGWLAVRVQAQQRRHLLEWTTDLRRLDSTEFEWFVGEVFRREGWRIEETGRQSGPDGNIDLRLTKGAYRAIVQCKRWTANRVGVDQIRAFGGTLLREGLPPSAGIFVTLSDFHDAARLEAAQLGVALVDGRDLYERAEKVRTPEPCDKCGSPMLLDRSIRGWWFRCLREGCPGKRDLGSDPARAVELLTQSPTDRP